MMLWRLKGFVLFIVCASLPFLQCVTSAEAEPALMLPVRPQVADIASNAVTNNSSEGILARLYGADLELAGVDLRRDLLRRLYAARGYEPIWEARQAQAASLWNAILNADEHGLDPNAFHASLIGRVADRIDRDLLLSDAFLAYADALAHGAVPVEKRKRTQNLAPGRVDVVAVLEAAIMAADPATLVNALAPNSPAYTELRQAHRYYRYAGDVGRARCNQLEMW